MAHPSRLRWQRHDADTLRRDAALRRQWDALNDTHLALPFMAAEVILAALECFGPERASLLVVHDAAQGDAPCMMAIVEPVGRLRWQTFQPSQLPLGAWVGAAGLDLDTALRTLLQDGAFGRTCLAVSWTQVDPRQCERRDDLADNQHDDYIATAWIDVAGAFDDYWAQRGKNLRQNLRKQRNKLATDGVTTQFIAHTAPEAMPSALARYGALETAGWKAEGGTAISADNAQGRFYAAVLDGAARRGEAVVSEYRFNDRTVAMNLALVRNGVRVVLKTAYDESVPKTFSPASLLREDEMRQCFDHDGVRRIEFYGRMMEWHTKLTERQRTLYHLTTYRWPWVKQLALRRRPAPAPEVSATPVEAT